MSPVEKYVRRYASGALREIRKSAISSLKNGLDIFERALIYHYTWDGYLSINRSLRRAGNGNRAARLLQTVLEKLPNEIGLVYRTARLTKRQLQAYRIAYEREEIIVEPTFISTSRSQTMSRDYPGWNVQFQIFTITGRSIEDYSRLGRLNPPNEQEILIPPGRSFRVRQINDLETHVLIIMREVEI